MMKLFGKDIFNIEIKQRMNDEQLSSLSFFYASLLSDNSLRLYLFLYSLPLVTHREMNHQELARFLNLNLDEIETARKELEQVGLLKTLVKNNNNSNSYLYILNTPNTPNEFLNNQLLSRIFESRFGSEVYKTYKIDNFKNDDSEKYTDITEKMGFSYLKDWTSEDEEKYRQSTDDSQFKDYSFDLEGFNRIINYLTFPNELRTTENYQQICSFGELYGISPMEMHTNVYKSIVKDEDNKPVFLDLDKLRYYCLKTETIYHNSKLGDGPYDLAPVSFLRKKQNGINKIASSDAKLLDSLIHEWKLPIPVCNVLIEYALETCDGKLTKNFIEKICSSWKRSNVDTVEKALRQIGKKVETNEKIVEETTELSNEELIKQLKEGLRNGKVED